MLFLLLRLKVGRVELAWDDFGLVFVLLITTLLTALSWFFITELLPTSNYCDEICEGCYEVSKRIVFSLILVSSCLRVSAWTCSA